MAALVLPGFELLEYSALRFAAEALRQQITFGSSDASKAIDAKLADLRVNYDDPKFVRMSENERQVEAFLERHPEFAAVPVADVWRDALGVEPPSEIGEPYLRLSPLRHGTDGFFAAALVRKPTAAEEAPDRPADQQLDAPRSAAGDEAS